MKTATELYELGLSNLDDLVAYCLALQEKLATTSRNSSKPPSKDGLNKPKPKSLRGKTGKKSGGQPGHPGTTLKPVEKPDHIEIHPLVTCPCGCGGNLSIQPVLGHESRQVFELPPQKLVVTEHRVEVKRCPISGKLVHSPWPAGVTAPVQYGPDFLAWLTYLNTQQLIPLTRIGQMNSDLFGQHVSEDTILKAIDTTNQQLPPFTQAISEQFLQAPVVNADESGVRVEHALKWLHVLSTPTLTWYGISKKRGREALDAFDILPKYIGRLVHDCWPTYFDLPCQHALCVAHLLRELTFIHEECDQAWAKALIDLFLDMNTQREKQRLVTASFPPERVCLWHQQYQDIIEKARVENPPLIPLPDAPKKRGRKKQTKAQNLIDRLELHEDSVLAFLHDFRIPFTNNLAEQDIRMIKIKQNVSGSFRTFKGAERFATIRSYISTARKNGKAILQALKEAIIGDPFIPEIPASE